uniref:Photolyase/cryptochrome alpha/beta domain-containing protein n=1 Tax=Peronospora matthiolae TaxID=2874970 RepID=A0AAV1UXG7_9STRA
MSTLDAVEVRRIATQLAALKQQRNEATSLDDDEPIRLYRLTNSSAFVRVLDDYPEPISSDMLATISAFIAKNKEDGDCEEMNATVKNEADEKTTRKEQQDTLSVASSTLGRQKRKEIDTDNDTVRVNGGDNVSEDTIDNANRDVNADVTGDTTVTSNCAATAVDQEDVGVTKPELVQVSRAADIVPPWEKAAAVKNIRDLVLDQKEGISDVLNQKVAINRMQELDCSRKDGPVAAEVGTKDLESVDHSTLFEQWPHQLEEQRKLWFMPRISGRKASVVGVKNQPVVYWMHNTLRVIQGNYGLEAAIMLSRRLSAPLVVVCLVSSSIIHPVCHATTASDAYARYSLVELYQQFKQAGVPFFGLSATESEMSEASDDLQFSPKPHPLYEMLDAFEPHVVVTDAMFDSPSRRDMVHLARYLELHRSSCSWSLLSMDSMTCCPAYQLSTKLQSTFERDTMFASEEQFGVEYASCLELRDQMYIFSPLPRVGALDPAADKRRSEMVSAVMQRLHLEEINWQVVKAENAQSNTRMQRFSEGEGLQKLSQLLSDLNSQPAIQTELHGGGVLSLLPFIRHGTLFVGYVLRRMTDAITACPIPTTPQERKALAMRKVMRSRAVNHLAKERDYILYLSLWSASRTEPSGSALPDIALLSTSEIIAGLKSYAPRPSALEAYRKLLPGWAYSAARMVDNCNSHTTGAASYDPLELESARTNDPYWNDIQKSLVEQQYLHPLLIVYWAYRVFTWSVSCRAAVATIESLISQCALGSWSSPDAVFIVWKLLFRLGSNSTNTTSIGGDGKTSPTLEDLRRFQSVLENELASQPKLQLRP